MALLLSCHFFSRAQGIILETTDNTACQGVPCGWNGPKVLINEFMISPSLNDGSISGPGPSGGRGEWVELYNPDACNPIDISCYILGNTTFEGTGGIRIPPNTVIPPSGFAVIRGVDALTVPPAALASNGGNVVVVTVAPDVNAPEICAFGNPANRFWFPNSGGWFAVYDENGEPQDAVRWGTANISSLNGMPCVPGGFNCPELPITSLLSYNQIPLNRKFYASITNGNFHYGESIRRLTDGGIWNSYGPPTIGLCNSTCFNTIQTVCTGTATVTSAPGNPPYTYQWNDPLNQTTPHVIGLCQGQYDLIVTSQDGIVSTASFSIDLYTPTVSLSESSFCLNQPSETITGYNPIPSGTQSINLSGSGVSNNIFNPSSAGVGDHLITFTFSDQSGCANSTSALFTVHPTPNVSLNAPQSVCITDDPFQISVSPIEGTLSGPGIIGNMFHPNLAGAGTHQISFNYFDPNGCTNPQTTILTTTITVNALETPIFNFQTSFCEGSNIPSLPTTSNQGIIGSWTPIINNTQTTQYTFVPNSGQCAAQQTSAINIVSANTPVFNAMPSFCIGDNIPSLPTFSNNGIEGVWSPAINNQTTTNYTFTPVPVSNGPGFCAIPTTTTIVVNPILNPTFNTINPVCAGSNIPTLPNTSLNNVSGTWSPSINNQQTTTYTFTPASSECAANSSLEIIVVSGVVEITCPTTQTLACFSQLDAPYTSLIDFFNAGGALSNSNALLVQNTFALSQEIANGESCEEIVTRIYTYSNVCGQTATCTQTILINDTIPPSGQAPNNISVQCISDVPAPDITSVTNIFDNCATPSVSHLSDVSVGSCPELISRTYRIEDNCGNFMDVTLIITVLDTISPTGIAPENATISCLQDLPVPNINLVTNVSDNCSVPVVSHLNDQLSGTCPTLVTRTYRITDNCGNFTDVQQIFTVLDTIPPTGNPPGNLVVNCSQDVPQPNINSVSNLSDNCSIPIVQFLSDASSGSCPEIITRVYRISDDCGNFTDLVQLITILDTIPPSGVAPANIVVSCPSNIPPPDVNSVTNVTDNCQIATVSHVNDISNGNLCNMESITRTYKIEDACGNETFVSQQITVDLLTPTATLSASNPTTCQGNEGHITISNLYPNTAYVINYNNISFQVLSDPNGEVQINDLVQGTYANFVIAYSQCTSCPQILNDTIVLVDPPNPIINAGTDISFCDGNQFFLQADNPENATISWSDNIPDGSLITPPVGVYFYTVTAILNNCISHDQITVTVHPIPTVDAGSDISVCAGSPIILNGNGAQTYHWNNNVIDGEPFFQLETFKTYEVIGVTELGCFNTDEISITLLENPYPTFNSDGISSCVAPFSVNFSNTSQLPVFDCNWVFDNGITASGSCDNVEAVFEHVGCFGVALYVEYTNGCSNWVYSSDVACIFPTPTAQFYATPSIQEVNSDIFFFNASQDAVNYFWYFNDEDPPVNQKNVIYNYETSGQYEITLVAINEYNCSDTTKQIIEVENPLLLFVPNAFTPDGDQFNNEFKPIMATGFDPWNYELTIFNRSGEILFVSQNADYGWPGTYDGKLVQQGTYIWQIQVKNEKGITEMHKGFVNLLK